MKNFSFEIKFSPKFIGEGKIFNKPALVQVMAWCRTDDTPLFEAMMF